jgi:hypothetical protein
MTKKKRERKVRRHPARGKPDTLGESRPEIRALERATGNPMRVREMPDGSLVLDFTTPKGAA